MAKKSGIKTYKPRPMTKEEKAGAKKLGEKMGRPNYAPIRTGRILPHVAVPKPIK